MAKILHHPLLGRIRGRKLSSDLVQYAGLPYAIVQQRFGRSTTLRELPATSHEPFDATRPGPECIQPENATKLDAEANQFPHDDFEEQAQSEDCLYLNITAPAQPASSPLPVLVFLHGGALFLASASRPYYSPFNFLTHAMHKHRPFIFVSMNYRLGALGFLHSPLASSIIPPNNGLHDQLRAFEWLRHNIAGFNGDPDRITTIGQSAGGESVSLHTISSNPTPLFHQMIAFSGSPVTMPCKTPAQHQSNFHALAKKLGVQDLDHKNPAAIAQEFVSAPISRIRDLSSVGAPCSSSELLPYEHPTMALTRCKPPSLVVPWLKRAIYSSTTFDGSVSYNLLVKSKKENAKTFSKHVSEILSGEAAEELLSLYQINEQDSDTEALKKICQFETDIGFFAASMAQVSGSPARDRYLQIFDLKNPFDGSHSGNRNKALPKNTFASHTWDIVALLGKYDEYLDEENLTAVRRWRDKILAFIYEEQDDGVWDKWEETDGKALRVAQGGLEVQTRNDYMGEDDGRRKKLLELAERINGDQGQDHFWEGVCRPWLDG